MTLRVKTKDLPPAIRHLIREMREGLGKYTLAELVAAEKNDTLNGETTHRSGLPTDDGFSYSKFTSLVDAYTSQKGRKRYSPKEVRVEFQPGAHVQVNVAGFSFNAVNGKEVSRDAETTTSSREVLQAHRSRRPDGARCPDGLCQRGRSVPGRE